MSSDKCPDCIDHDGLSMVQRDEFKEDVRFAIDAIFAHRSAFGYFTDERGTNEVTVKYYDRYEVTIRLVDKVRAEKAGE